MNHAIDELYAALVTLQEVPEQQLTKRERVALEYVIEEVAGLWDRVQQREYFRRAGKGAML